MADFDRQRVGPAVERMRIAVIGGGGFRAPIVWESLATIAEDAHIEGIVLQDISEFRLSRVATVIDGRRREIGEGPPVRITTSMIDAVEGADVVFCAIRVGGIEGRVVDETVPLREGVLGQETVGPGGISFALRTLPVMLNIARIVRARSPSAWFLNFTNPAGLITQGLRSELGDRAIGICDAPATLFGRVASALGRNADDLSFDYAGLNHLGWLLAVRDGRRDLLPDLLADEHRVARVEEARLAGPRRVRRLGLIPNEYLVYYNSPKTIVDTLRRAGMTRAEVLMRAEDGFYNAATTTPAETLDAWRRARDLRFGTYMAEVRNEREEQAAPSSNVDAKQAAGSVEENGGDPQGPGDLGYAAIAAAFLRAISGEKSEELALNVANNGRLPFLDTESVVEVSCNVDDEGPTPAPGRPLPEEVANLVLRVKEVENLTIRSAVEGRRDLALEAIAAHPVVDSRSRAERILMGYLNAFPDLSERLK